MTIVIAALMLFQSAIAIAIYFELVNIHDTLNDIQSEARHNS